METLPRKSFIKHLPKLAPAPPSQGPAPELGESHWDEFLEFGIRQLVNAGREQFYEFLLGAEYLAPTESTKESINIIIHLWAKIEQELFELYHDHFGFIGFEWSYNHVPLRHLPDLMLNLSDLLRSDEEFTARNMELRKTVIQFLRCLERFSINEMHRFEQFEVREEPAA